MSNEKANKLLGSCVVPGSAGAGYVSDTFTLNDGLFTHCTRGGAGSYTLVLSPGIDPGEGVIICSVINAAALEISIAHADDEHKTVHISDNLGAATDSDFSVTVWQVLN